MGHEQLLCFATKLLGNACSAANSNYSTTSYASTGQEVKKAVKIFQKRIVFSLSLLLVWCTVLLPIVLFHVQNAHTSLAGPGRLSRLGIAEDLCVKWVSWRY
jgi:hypothetical protein